MRPKKTFLDSGVLISAARGTDSTSLRALQILDDHDRAFVSSIFVKLEVLPKAVYNGFLEETAFYQSFFENDVDLWVNFNDDLAEIAQQQAGIFGLSALDAIHVASSISAGVDEFVTTEKPGKPMYRVKGIRVRSIFE
ncbi:MAG: type II toxin-antitoxin system VapC family toxin [Methanothrix sp.]